MLFKMSKEAKTMYKSITRSWDQAPFTMWDFYYFCFSVGLSKRNLNATNKLTGFSHTMEVQYFVFRSEILAALVSAEIERKGLNWSRENVVAEFVGLTDPSEPLSPKGQELLNYYAEGGFDIIFKENLAIRNPVEFVLVCGKVVRSETAGADENL